MQSYLVVLKPILEIQTDNPSEFKSEKAMAGMSTNPRSSQPEEIASLALYLCSEESSFISGKVILVDGG